MNILDLSKSNDEIIKLIEKNEPFSISRLGMGRETKVFYQVDSTNTIDNCYLNSNPNLFYNCGIYCKDEKNYANKIKLFITISINAIKNSDLLASFDTHQCNMINIQDAFSNKYNLKQIFSRTLEPFYQLQENIKPWTHYLLGKKVLIINSFVDSFKKQLDNNFQIFKDPNKKIFLDGQEFIFYKSFQTIAGNHIHNDWFETFKIMCNDISKLDFDIALLGCGGYGLPLCNFIKNNLKKSAIYVGGGLQLLFGVIGQRWENRDIWKKIIEENDTKFINPSGDEICNNYKNIEDGCYW